MDESQLAGIIDTEWHHSWHWERDEFGNITLQGYKTALQNAIEEKAYCQQRIKKLDGALDFIKSKIALMEVSDGTRRKNEFRG